MFNDNLIFFYKLQKKEESLGGIRNRNLRYFSGMRSSYLTNWARRAILIYWCSVYFVLVNYCVGLRLKIQRITCVLWVINFTGIICVCNSVHRYRFFDLNENLLFFTIQPCDAAPLILTTNLIRIGNTPFTVVT